MADNKQAVAVDESKVNSNVFRSYNYVGTKETMLRNANVPPP